jgi:hypothetical protein
VDEITSVVAVAAGAAWAADVKVIAIPRTKRQPAEIFRTAERKLRERGDEGVIGSLERGTAASELS